MFRNGHDLTLLFAFFVYGHFRGIFACVCRYSRAWEL